MRVARYDTADEHDWNVFVRSSKNGTFLFDRGYMDYHADRFCDFSLVVRDHREAVIAVLPASKRERTLISHEGLTFGGFVSSARMTSARMLMVLDVSLEFLRSEGFEELVYKAVPHIYHSLPAEEDGYALFAVGQTSYDETFHR